MMMDYLDYYDTVQIVNKQCEQSKLCEDYFF